MHIYRLLKYQYPLLWSFIYAAVCMNTLILVIIRATDFKFDIQFPLYHMQLKFIRNSKCHAQKRPEYSLFL